MQKERSDQGIKRGPYEEKRPVGIKEGAARASGHGLRGRYIPKRIVLKTSDKEALTNNYKCKAGNDNLLKWIKNIKNYIILIMPIPCRDILH